MYTQPQHNFMQQNELNALKMRELINKKQQQINTNNISMRPGYYNDQLKRNAWRTLQNY